jgi:hypothetical protein
MRFTTLAGAAGASGSTTGCPSAFARISWGSVSRYSSRYFSGSKSSRRREGVEETASPARPRPARAWADGVGVVHEDVDPAPALEMASGRKRGRPVEDADVVQAEEATISNAWGYQTDNRLRHVRRGFVREASLTEPRSPSGPQTGLPWRTVLRFCPCGVCAAPGGRGCAEGPGAKVATSTSTPAGSRASV